MLGVMEPLLPETSEGSNARARPDEDARLGGVFWELEAIDTAGRQEEKDLGLQTPRARNTCRTGLGGWVSGMVGLSGREGITDHQVLCTGLSFLPRQAIPCSQIVK